MNKNIKITMVMVMSIDGIISRTTEESVSVWSSNEDKVFFNKLIEKADGIITGRKSFKKQFVKQNKFYYILTHNNNLQSDANLRYVSGYPKDILAMTAKDNIKNLLLLGGAQTNYLFLKENMVDDLFLTIEPKMFGTGKHLNICKKLDIQLQLMSCKVLNKTGTLLLHYTVKKQE